MDSPLVSPQTNPTGYLEDIEEDEASSLLLLRQWAFSIKPLYKALFFAILGCILSVLVLSSLPLWRPMGVLMMHKLWDILRFFVIITSIGLGIINSKPWRGDYRDRDAISLEGKDDSISSKVPFAGMFYSEFQPSYSFTEKEQEVGEDGVVSRTVSGNGGESSANITPLTAADVRDDESRESQNFSKLQVTNTITALPRIKVKIGQESIAKIAEDDRSVPEKPSITLSFANHPRKEVPRSEAEEPSFTLSSANSSMKELPTTVKRQVRKPCEDMDLATVVEDDHPKHNSKVGHRRGKSLEFSIEQEVGVPRHRDINSTSEHHRRAVDASGEKPSSSRNASSSAFKESNQVKHASDEFFSLKSNMNAASASSSTVSTSRHSRSRSAYDIKELLVDEPGVRIVKPRSKPGTTSSQLAKRRNASLSCDLDKDYTDRGVPAWLASLPSPPAPPLIDEYSVDASRGVLCGQTSELKQDEGSLRKAYSDSLAPWRAAKITTPVEVPKKEAIKESKRRSTISEENKKSPLKENTGVGSPPSSPSTPNSFMGSPSPGELNKKVDAFITRFHERMRLQRLESLKRSRQRPH